MANKVRKIKNGQHVIPGFSLTVGVMTAMLSVFILIPLASVLGYAFRMPPSDFVKVITDDSVVASLITSIGCALGAALINCVFGLILAWVLVRFNFPGKRILDGMIELPFALPTAVAGITLSKMYANTGELGGPLSKIGINVSYTHLGILIALVFVGIPFVVRTVQPVLEQLSPSYEEAAYILGAKRSYTFRKVILPELMPPLLTGFSLALARGIGEYGSVIYISGNSEKNKTQVVSYIIMQKLNYLDYESATAIALLMLIISFLLLLLTNVISSYQTHHAGSKQEFGRKAIVKTSGFTAGEKILIGISVVFEFFMLLFPLFSVIKNSLAKGLEFYLNALQTDYVISAFGVTILATVIALAVNTVFGLVAAWALTRYTFRGQHVLGALIDTPFSVSPVIAGLAFIMTFGRLGWANPIIEAINDALGTDIQIVFALPGVMLATIFVTFPFISRELIPVLNAVGTSEEEAATLMGASGFTIFRKITFPHIKWPLIYGMILCGARALGEFGAVNALSKTRGETFTLPLEIDALYLDGSQDSITAAFAVSSILVIMAVVTLFIRNIFEYREKKDVS